MKATAATMATLDSVGRVVIPAKVRQTLGVENGGEVVLTLVGNTLQIQAKSAARQAARDLVRKALPAGVSLAAELSQDRAEEASNE